ncbi:MAG: homoserine dehydrogenase [Pirellulales bacterium]|nr:homoserine dehydrogenase [Pirellulales bacterium]
MEKTKVGIVGMGTVGRGVARLLLNFGDRTARHAGRILWLERAVVRDLSKPRPDVDLPDNVLSADLDEILEDQGIVAVAQLIGGLEPARTIMLRLLESGKNVVTANKALLAEHGPELFDRARELGRSIAFEAAVAGGIPIVTNISQCLSANQINSIAGILNGTSNFILSEMEESGASYSDAVAKAQELGYAEADPSMDVDGSDAAQKLAILAHLAFGVRVPWREIPLRGISSVNPADLRYAEKLGYRIRLLAVAQAVTDGVELHVSPTLVPIGTPLAEVRGAYNAVRVHGDAVGSVFYHGLGAGQMPTASAVVADLIDTVVGRLPITFRTLKLWSDDYAVVSPKDPGMIPGRFYMRFDVDDRPGVLAQITAILGRYQISIAAVIQHPEETTEKELSATALTASETEDVGNGHKLIVPLVIMTHETTEKSTRDAVSEIARLDCVHGECTRMRVGN